MATGKVRGRRPAGVVPQVLRILWVLLVVQLLITFVPPITLFLPSFLK